LLQVGKTSLINALKDLKDGRSAPIAPEHRTVSVQVSRQLLGDGVDLRIWDFAGAALAVSPAL
jgi:GTPase SAR1 family protein